MARAANGKPRKRGQVRRRGGSYEVRVYAGIDPVTGQRSYLSESAPDAKAAEAVRAKLVTKVDAQRAPETRGTVAYLLDEWMAVHEAEPKTLVGYRGYIENYLKPALGGVPVLQVNARVLERFYAQLRRCRQRCGTPVGRTPEDGHDCRPLAASSIRQIHIILSGALNAAVRWEWISSNPASTAKKPRLPSPQPTPPSTTDAAAIAAEAWKDSDDWGMLIWLAMVTGARRGELVALRWSDLNLHRQILEIRRAYTRVGGQDYVKETKTHQIRRIALDETTSGLLAQHWERYENRCRELAIEPNLDTYLFSYAADHARPASPDAITHRYAKMCKKLGVPTRFHSLRHYTATELIAAGADVRSVAGRLGHAGGGTTTLRVYAAWVGETDRRAAEVLAAGLTPPGNHSDA